MYIYPIAAMALLISIVALSLGVAALGMACQRATETGEI
jgi:hypothetical protein